MRVIEIEKMKLAEPERSVKFTGGISHRVLLEKDGMGFSLHQTCIPKGGPHRWHYKNHVEACYCISGHGELIDLETGNQYIIEPGTTYVLDNHDDHTFEAFEDTVLISVFNPAVTGQETHDKDGSYDIPANLNKGLATLIVNTCNSCKDNYTAVESIQKLLNTHR